MNLALFQPLHAVAHFSPLVDAAIVFTADYLAFIFFFALLGYEGWQWIKGRRARARGLLRAIGVSGFAWLAAEALKVIVASPRPFLVIKGLEPLITHGGYDSFPSGHVTFFFALGMALFFSVHRPFFSSTSSVFRRSAPLRSSSTPDVFPKNGRSLCVLGILFMSVAFLMGLARVVAGIHWPVDIMGGIILGSCIAVVFANRLRSGI